MPDKAKSRLEWKPMTPESSHAKFGLTSHASALLRAASSVVCWGREFGGCKTGECGARMMAVRPTTTKIWHRKHGQYDYRMTGLCHKTCPKWSKAILEYLFPNC